MQKNQYKKKLKLKFFFKPILVAFGVTIFWLFLKLFKILPKTDLDQTLMTSGTISVLGIFYALVAAFVLSTVWRQFIAVEEAIKLKNKTEFVKHKDKRIPLPIKALLFFSSFLVMGSFFTLNFGHNLTGMYTMLSVSLSLALNWAVVMDLDHPFEGIWNLEIPKGWEKLEGKINHDFELVWEIEDINEI